MRADAREIIFDALFGRKTVTVPIAFGYDVSYSSVGADAHIGPYKPINNIGTKSCRESHSFAPE